LRGLEVSVSGEKNRRYAVGPREGKTKGLFVKRARIASRPIVMKPLIRT
jgi:hypothetical protein